jgi:hypothetical protein
VPTITFANLAPKYWALATFFIPIAGALGYGVWLVTSAAGLAQSTRAEEIVRGSALLIVAAVLTPIARPWARAIGIAFIFALVLMLVGMLQFEVFRGL